MLTREKLVEMAENLKGQREKVCKVIALLEEVQRMRTPQRRGRKSMGEAERQIVGARMRNYWSKRRRKEAQL